jgi:hypothetical protein
VGYVGFTDGGSLGRSIRAVPAGVPLPTEPHSASKPESGRRARDTRSLLVANQSRATGLGEKRQRGPTNAAAKSEMTRPIAVGFAALAGTTLSTGSDGISVEATLERRDAAELCRGRT